MHRLMVSGSDRSALQWRRDQAIDGAEALELQHLYRAMGWLGEALGEREPDAPSPQGKITKNFLGSMSYCESDVDFSDKAISIHRHAWG